MKWKELNLLLTEIEREEHIKRQELCDLAGIQRTHVSRQVNNEPEKIVGTGILSKLKLTFPKYFGMPADNTITAERALLKVLLRDYAEYKAKYEPDLTADGIVADLESKARIILDIVKTV